jgi:hypothetical protein
VLCAFRITLLMWLSHHRVLWMFKPRFLAELTLFSTCPWMVYLYSYEVFIYLLWSVELCTCPGWIVSGIAFSHFCIVSRPCYRVHTDLIFRYRKQSSVKSLVVDSLLQIENSFHVLCKGLLCWSKIEQLQCS